MQMPNQPAHIPPPLNKPKPCTEPDFGNDIERHIDSPGSEIEFLARLREPLIQNADPFCDFGIDQGFHPLDVCETVGRGGHLAVMGVLLPVLDIEKGLGFAKGARDVVFRFVGLPVVDEG